jgi:hypothetical protein
MRFLLDQSAEARIGIFLISIGHDATRVGKDHPPGLPDFGELIFKQLHPHAGVIYLRFPLDTTASQKLAAIERLLTDHADDLDRYLTVTPRGVRVRR